MDSDELHQTETCEQVFRSGIWRTVPVIDSERFQQWEAEGKIFAIVYNEIKYYADYQFGEDNIPLPFFKEVLKNLRSKDPWCIAAWFHFPNSWIANGAIPVAPKDALHRERDVIMAALHYRATYIA